VPHESVAVPPSREAFRPVTAPSTARTASVTGLSASSDSNATLRDGRTPVSTASATAPSATLS
jgi:hypothetical protein